VNRARHPRSADPRRVRPGGAGGADLRAFEAARRRLGREFAPTRLIRADALSERLSLDVHLKLETELPTGSFKVRGALHALSRRLDVAREAGEAGPVEVVASSTGNHGAAVAWAARRLGVSATIFLPDKPNPVKRDRILKLGARVFEAGPDLAAAARAADAHARDAGAYFLNDATDPVVPVGAGTLALELREQLPEMRTVIVPMGDTALIRGVASVVKAGSAPVEVIGVQTEGAPAYVRSWEAGRAVSTERCDTLADGLATRTPEPANVERIRALVDRVCLVSDSELLAAMRRLILDEHVVAEPAGAASTAAALRSEGLEGPLVLLVTGANLTPTHLRLAVLTPDSEEPT